MVMERGIEILLPNVKHDNSESIYIHVVFVAITKRTIDTCTFLFNSFVSYFRAGV